MQRYRKNGISNFDNTLWAPVLLQPSQPAKDTPLPPDEEAPAVGEAAPRIATNGKERTRAPAWANAGQSRTNPQRGTHGGAPRRAPRPSFRGK